MSAKIISLPPYLVFLFKISVSCVLVFMVLTKMDWKELSSIQATSLYRVLPVSVLAYLLSKFASAVRQHQLLSKEGINISYKENLKIYWLGMFYNTLLPGGVGGDMIKAIQLHKLSKVPLVRIAKILLLDRLSGMVVLLSAIALLGWIILPHIGNIGVWTWLACFLACFPLMHGIHYYLSPVNKAAQWKGWLLSAMVQGIQGLMFLYIVFNLGNHEVSIAPCMFIFFLSSLAASLPLSIGGIGVREYIFLVLASHYSMPSSILVSGSFIFYLSSLAASLPGVFFTRFTSTKKTGT
ncbi:MAG: flippase-like domain-containing protein [Cytophagaceae bacterium]|jgi:hypothetical protein|nr:flippase-like domain-containing protein [Cytophagaceae bacterium]